MILVDTNAWVSHARAKDTRLAAMLEQNRVVTADVVLGELMLGSGLPPALVRDLALLPRLPSPSAAQTRAYIERYRRTFRAFGVGWADAQIILTAADSGALLYSSDGAVRTVWRRLGFRLA
ncbi:MAG: PIN domain-containing protein [Myxococcales bacterium]|nr:PIN domain-containing protein [Myxococcales bacterium]